MKAKDEKNLKQAVGLLFSQEKAKPAPPAKPSKEDLERPFRMDQGKDGKPQIAPVGESD